MSKRSDRMRVNEAIRAREVRVIKSNGEQAGILSIAEARNLATEEGLDLVEIAPTSDPPVCRIMNYGKFRFQQSKKMKDSKQKQRHIQVKEIKFRPRIEEHDYQTKLRRIIKFLKQGDKVRAFVQFRGREMVHRDIGLRILERVMQEIDEIAVVERVPSTDRMEGNQMSMFLISRETAAKSKK